MLFCQVKCNVFNEQVRDMARTFKAIKAAAEKGDTGAFSQFSQRYVEWGGQVTQPAKPEEKEEAYSGWMLGSLAFVMGYPLESHAPLPEWCIDPLPDAVRDAAEAAHKPIAKAANAVAAISSSNFTRPEDHMSSRAFQKSNIAPMAAAPETLEDLDLFYDSPGLPAPKKDAPAAAASAQPSKYV